MLHFMRRSLLVQLLSVYLLFVMVVLIAGVVVNAVVEQQLSNDAQASDQALAQEIALQTSLQLANAEQSVKALGNLALLTHRAWGWLSLCRARNRSDIQAHSCNARQR